MIRFLLFFVCALFSQSVFAKENTISPEKAQKIINSEFLTPKVVKNTGGLKSDIDYITNNYSEGDLHKLILSREELERKVAKQLGETYVPYDRKVNVKNPSDIKRYFRARSNVIY